MDNRIDLKNSMIYLSIKLKMNLKNFQKKYLSRFYINCFSPKDEFSCGTLMLLQEKILLFGYNFPDYRYDLEEGGETQFILDDEIYGIIPQPNRMISFPAQILHRATSLRTRYRFTVAIKYISLNIDNITDNMGKKIAIVGAGNAGCISALQLYFLKRRRTR